MRRLVCALLVFLLLLSPACSKKEGAKIEWRRVTCPIGRFSIEMPGDPLRSGGEVPAAKTSDFFVQVGVLEQTYFVLYVEMPILNFFGWDLEKALTNTARERGSRITLMADVRVEGGKAKEIDAVRQDGERESIRLIQIGERRFTLSVKGKNAYLSDPNVQRFFGSFKLTK